MITKTKRSVPVCSVTVDADVRLDEFDNCDIAEYLRDRGYYVSVTPQNPHDQEGDPPNVLDPDELNRIETLLICGQRDAARASALALVSEAIGRSL